MLETNLRFSYRERLACKVLSHLQYDKKTDLFLDNWFNHALWWECERILKVDVFDLLRRVAFEMNTNEELRKRIEL